MSIIYDIAKTILGSKIDEADDSGDGRYAEAFKRQFSKMNAITKQAKSAVHTYPVIFSEGVVVSDEELLYAISKFLEIHYAVFTMTAVGMSPILEGTDPKTHLLKFYSEESGNGPDEEEKDLTIEDIIPGIGKTDPEISLSNVDEDSDKPWDPSVAEISLSNEKMNMDENLFKEYKSSEESKDDSDDLKERSLISQKMLKIEKKTHSYDPTIVQVKLKMAKGRHEVEFPLAVKAIPRIITSQESSRIFQYLKEDRPLVGLIKLMSGEVKIFRDIIFQLERAKKDKELYNKLGRHPWFREMMEKRSNRKVKNLLLMIPELNKFIKNKSDVIPICSLIVTKEELEKGMGNMWSNIKKRNENIMDKMMLLCLGVIDTTSSTAEFAFYGWKNNIMIKLDTLIKEYNASGGSSKDLEKLLQTLLYKNI